MALYSESILEAVKAALEGIEILPGTKAAPVVERFDQERGRIEQLPCIRVSRSRESYRQFSGRARQLHKPVEVLLEATISVFSYRDPESSETYDQIVADDVGGVIDAIDAMDWDELRAVPSPLTWSPLAVRNESEPEHGAVIDLSVNYVCLRGQLGMAADPMKYGG